MENQKQGISSTGVLTVGTIHKLFAKLQARYGNQWTNQWDDDRIYKMAINEWFNELQHLTTNQLREGLDNYKGDYPPNLIQFYEACTQKQIGRPAPYYQTYKSLKNDKNGLLEDESKKKKREEYMQSRGNAYLERIRRENGWIK